MWDLILLDADHCMNSSLTSDQHKSHVGTEPQFNVKSHKPEKR